MAWPFSVVYRTSDANGAENKPRMRIADANGVEFLRPGHDRWDQRAPFQTHTSEAESGRPCMLLTITVCLRTES